MCRARYAARSCATSSARRSARRCSTHLLDELSRALRNQLDARVLGVHRRLPQLRDQEISFLTVICPALKPFFVNSGEFIVYAGVVSLKMFWLHHGLVRMLDCDDTVVAYELKDGSVFGFKALSRRVFAAPYGHRGRPAVASSTSRATRCTPSCSKCRPCIASTCHSRTSRQRDRQPQAAAEAQRASQQLGLGRDEQLLVLASGMSTCSLEASMSASLSVEAPRDADITRTCPWWRAAPARGCALATA